MGIISWIKGIKQKTEFDKAFAYLNNIASIKPNASKVFDLLKELNFDTSDLQLDNLLAELKKIKYASNTNDVYYFYFPIVTHILFYKPKYEKDILDYLIEPNFANGTTETIEMISLIQGAMKFKLSESKNYLTKESQKWIMIELPKMENEVEREIQKCWKELDE